MNGLAVEPKQTTEPILPESIANGIFIGYASWRAATSAALCGRIRGPIAKRSNICATGPR